MVFELLLFFNCISLRISQECLYLLCILFLLNINIIFTNNNSTFIQITIFVSIVRYRNFNYRCNKRTNKELLIVKKK